VLIRRNAHFQEVAAPIEILVEKGQLIPMSYIDELKAYRELYQDCFD